MKTPLLFSIAFVLVLFNKNISEAPLRVIVTPLLFAILSSAFFILVSRFFFSNHLKSSLFATFLTITFFAYSGEETTLILYALATIALFIFLRRTNKKLATINRFLFMTAVLSTIIPLGQIALYETHRASQTAETSPLPLPQADINSTSRPDIYFLLPEDYSASSVLENDFHYSNQPFEDFLRDHGFYVATGSASNYPKSFLSIASTLNMEYLDYLTAPHLHSTDQDVVAPLINNNNVLRFLKPLGYSYYQMGSWWGLTAKNPDADNNFILENENKLGVDEFSYAALRSTVLRPLINQFSPANIVTQSDVDKRRRIIYQFQKLPEVISLPGPKFVFFHLIAPHGPYVLDQNCHPITNKQSEKYSEETNYVNQINCIDSKLETAITQILASSDNKAVILLQTDEGAPFLGNRVNPADNWKTANTSLLREKFPIFSSYYLPGVSHAQLYPQITAVNSFRVILNAYFGTNLPLLPDKNYIFPDLKDLYNFRDVTAQVAGK